jgi:hypothetical protein
MADYSAQMPLMNDLASDVPGVSNLRKDLPGAMSAGMNGMAVNEAQDLSRRRGKALAEKAKFVGLDPNLVETVAQVDYGKALDMMIQATEKKNSADAEQYVGEQMGSDTFDPTDPKYNPGGVPMGSAQAQQLWQDGRNQKMRTGLENAQSSYVKQAWESRIAKNTSSLAEKRLQMQQQRQMGSDMRDAHKYLGDAIKSAGLGDAVTDLAGAKSMDTGLARIKDQIKVLNTTDPDAKFWAFSPLSTAVQQSSLASTVASMYTAWKGDLETKTILQTLKSKLDQGEDEQKALEDIKAANPNSSAINDALYGTLIMGIFENIHALTGAAMSEGERAGYLSAFGVGGPDGVNSVLEMYKRNREMRSSKLAVTKDAALQQLRAAYWQDETNPGYIAGAEYINNIKAPPPLDQELVDMLRGKNTNAIGGTVTPKGNKTVTPKAKPVTLADPSADAELDNLTAKYNR